MTKIILGLSGSLRRASINAGLLRAATEVAPDGLRIQIGSIHEVPLFNSDLEKTEGLPPAVQTLQAQLDAADGVLLVTPEYSNGIPGVFKNAVDWMSRGPGQTMWAGKPVALIGASPGGLGTVLAQNHWLPVLRTLKVAFWAEGRLMVSRAGDKFDESGTLTDDATREALATFLNGFAKAL